MAKSSTRRVTIYINGKEVEASVKQIRSEMNKLVNEQNRMVIGSDEYISHAKKIKELRQYLKEHAFSIRNEELAMRNVFQQTAIFRIFLHLDYTERIILYFCVAKRR